MTLWMSNTRRLFSPIRKQTLLSALAFFTLSRFQIDEPLADVPEPLASL
jgi:hypothetical protein